MPTTYRIDTRRRLVISKATGVLTAAEVLAHQSALRSDPLFQPGYDQLADFSETTDFQLTSAEIRRMAYETPFNSSARLAFVVPRPIQYGITHMFKIYAEDRKFKLEQFDNIAEASSWLGTDPPAHLPEETATQN